MAGNASAATFRDRLSLELSRRNISYKAFARMTGMSLSSLNTYLYRGSMPAADVAVRMAGVLGVSVEYLVSGGGSLPVESDRKDARGELIKIIDRFSDDEAERFLKIAEDVVAFRNRKA